MTSIFSPKRAFKNSLLTGCIGGLVLVGMFAQIIAPALFIGVAEVSAAPLKGYEALQVTSSGSGQINLKPGETRPVSVSFQNTGTASWQNDGEYFVSIYTHEPKYRSSVFKDASWFQSLQPVKITESLVKPGQVGTVKFLLKAPAQTGLYSESFQLAAEDKAWIPGGKFTLSINVSNDGSSSVAQTIPTPTTPVVSNGSSEGLNALLLLRSAKKLVAKGNERVSYTIGIKNSGTKAWKNREVRTPAVSAAFDSAQTKDGSWASSTSLISKQDGSVEPGSLDFMTFQFRAPSQAGTYVVRYTLAIDGVTVPGFAIDIPVDVTSSAPAAVASPVIQQYQNTTSNSYDSSEPFSAKIAEPMMRIAFLIVDDETDWKVNISCADNWKLVDGDGKVLYTAKANKGVEALYDDSVNAYFYNTGDGKKKSASHLRFVPDVLNTICTVNNFDRRVSRGFPYPDNTFRNTLELRHNDSKDRTWVINELPMEMYLRGLGETSNVSHEEFQKALLTIARTYALYHWERGTKYKDEFFHMTSYSWDQVYNGYGQEERAPRLTKSVNETTGRVVTYQGKTAITPYFSRSDGRTRDWSEVWYGTVPWIKSVPTPCDVGKTLWGHGVGLSASEALCQANQGKKWDEILHYFYQGVDLDRWW